MLSCIALICLLFAVVANAQEKPAATEEAAARPMRFDVISVKPAKPGAGMSFGFGPDGFSARGLPLSALIYYAYFPMNMSDRNPISGAPDWATKELWDVDAKVAAEDVAEYQKHRPRLDDPPGALGHQLLQSLLADRFHLVAHSVPAQMDGYALVVAKNGPKFREAASDEPQPAGSHAMPGGGYIAIAPRGEFPRTVYNAAKMSDLVTRLIGMGCAVVDRTGLTGRYDFTLSWLSSGPEEQHVGAIDSDDPDKLSHWDLDAMGLRAERVKLPTEHIVIDHVERPTQN